MKKVIVCLRGGPQKNLKVDTQNQVYLKLRETGYAPGNLLRRT